MKNTLPVLVIVVSLACPALAWEKLADEPEKFKGNVKCVSTKTTQFTRESGTWVSHGRPVQEEKELPDPSKPADQEVDDLEDTTSLEPAERNDVKGKQDEGYNAGYGDSSGSYGFYKVDDKDNILEAVRYSAKHELVGRDFYAYDENGNEIEKTCFTGDGKLKSRCKSRYDDKGNRIERTHYSSDGVAQRKLSWTYDSNKNVTQELYFERGTLKHKFRYTHKYDHVGNWTKRVEISEVLEGGQVTTATKEVSERVITYR